MEGEMKTIEQRAAKWGEYIAERTTYDVVGAKYSYIAGANSQKEIDDAELLKRKAEWEKEAQINHGIDMKSIEERAKEYSKDHWDELTAKEAYIAGANEQKEIDEEVRLKKFDDMTKEEYDREMAFADWYIKNGKGTPTYSDAIEWARKQTIDQACELIEKALQKLTTYKDKDNFTENEFKIITVSRVPNWLIKFRKEMEEQLNN